MIKTILTYFTSQLEEYLMRWHHQPEGLATVGFIGNSREERPNKIVVSLLNMERETPEGISAPEQRTPEDHTRKSPPLQLNLNVILAAVYDEDQYAESLAVLSDTLRFIQSAPRFEIDSVGYTVEIVSISTQDMNNIWTLLGGQYYPSVVCKIRRLTIYAEEITYGGKLSNNPSITL